MMFQVTHDVSQKNLPETYTKIIPKYKSLKDDLTLETKWIRYNDVVGLPCDYVWQKYYDEFIDHKILSKNNFYKLVKSTLNVKMKVMRTSDDSVKNCFVKKLIGD